MPRIREEPNQLVLNFDSDTVEWAPVTCAPSTPPQLSNVIKISFGLRRASAAPIPDCDHASVVKHVLLAAKKLSW
jgi:hypothetical protein